jgi:ribosomal protein L7/L12
MELIECKSCGSRELTEENGIVVCTFCQSRYVAQTLQTTVVSAPPKTHFDVVLQNQGRDTNIKIELIKQVRALTGLGLKESKDLVESAPRSVLTGVSLQEAESTKAQLERVGGVASIV